MEFDKELVKDSDTFKEAMKLIGRFEALFMGNELKLWECTKEDISRLFMGLETRKLRDFVGLALEDIYAVPFSSNGVRGVVGLFKEDTYEQNREVFFVLNEMYDSSVIDEVERVARTTNLLLTSPAFVEKLKVIKLNIRSFINSKQWNSENPAFKFLNQPVEAVVDSIYNNRFLSFNVKMIYDLLNVDPADGKAITRIFSSVY